MSWIFPPERRSSLSTVALRSVTSIRRIAGYNWWLPCCGNYNTFPADRKAWARIILRIAAFRRCSWGRILPLRMVGWWGSALIWSPWNPVLPRNGRSKLLRWTSEWPHSLTRHIWSIAEETIPLRRKPWWPQPWIIPLYWAVTGWARWTPVRASRDIRLFAILRHGWISPTERNGDREFSSDIRRIWEPGSPWSQRIRCMVWDWISIN